MLKEGLQQIIKSKSKTFLAFCFCFILGASIFSFLESTKLLFYLYISSFAVLFFVIVLWSKKIHRFFCFCLLVFILGGVRFLITIPEKSSNRIEFYNGNKKLVYGFVAREPDVGLSEARYIVRVETIKENTKDRNPKEVSGNIIVKTQIYPQYQYGDKLEVSCFLQEPVNMDGGDFNYEKYLAKQGVWSICANPQIKTLRENDGNFLIKIMLSMKNKIQSQISRLWPEPDSSLMAGILYGSRSGLPEDLKNNFSRTGVSHIVAVSGYNVSIIVVALNLILIQVGLWRRQSFWSLVFLILAFVFFTGASASVVRAGIMAVVVLVSQHVGRLSAVGRVLVYTVVIMLLFNPYLLMWDAGFQLSFLSTLGLVYLSPILMNVVENRLNIKNSFVSGIIEVLITTMSAIIATMPLILHEFEKFSVVAPLVNILILWVIPWLMLFGFLALILSFIFFPLGQLIAWVIGLGVRYVIIVVNWFGDKSWSAVDIKISLLTMVFIYLLLILFVTKKYQKVLGR